MDAEYLAELLDRHAPVLALYAAQWTPAADDVVQEAFIRLIDQRNTPDPPLPWLYRVVRNLAISQRRAATRRVRREHIAARLQHRSGSPDTQIELTDALDQLDDQTREIIVARLWGELTFEDIAVLVGLSSSTVHRRYQEGLATLRQLWEEPCHTP